jgi:protein SCO1
MGQREVSRGAVLGGVSLMLAAPASAANGPGAYSHLGFRQHPGAQLPLDTMLRDSRGSPVSLGAAIGGKPAVVVLEYLHCANLCGLVLRGAVGAMRDAQLVPDRDLSLVAISIDPRDTPADAARAEAMYGEGFADPRVAATGMHFLTGSPQAVARVATAVGFPYRFDRASGQFAHPAGFVVTTPKGIISRYMLGIGPPAAALKSAVAEAELGDVTPPAHPLLLLCFGYDPDPQTAAAMAMRIVRWVSIAVVLALALLVLFLSRRRRAA